MKVSPTEPDPDITFLGDVKIPGPKNFNSIHISTPTIILFHGGDF